MRKSIPTSIAAFTALLLASAVLTTFGVGSASAAEGSPWGANYFPNVPLVTHDGKTVRFYDDLLKGKIVVINLMYTSCGDSCPLETARLAQVRKLLGDRVGSDIFLYSITIDPERDTPAVLKQYAEMFHAGPGWLFLTGKKQDIELIRKKVGLNTRDVNEDNPNDHSTSLMIGNEATGQWRRHASLEDPQYLAAMIGDEMSGWKERKVVKSYAQVPPMPAPQKGQYLFRTRCAACHTIGGGDGLGPDLLGVTRIRDRAWLARWLAVPDQMLAERDPIATQLLAKYNNVPMPNLRLSETDVEALIEYMEAQSSALQVAQRKDIKDEVHHHVENHK